MENEQYEKLGSSELFFLNQAKKKFSDTRYEEMYLEWKKDNALFTLPGASKGQKCAVKTSFATYKINANYSAFGDLD